MRCPSCQRALPEPIPAYCPSCRRQLTDITSPPELSAPAAAPEQKRKNALLYIFAGLLALSLALAAVVVFKMLPENNSGSDTSSGRKSKGTAAGTLPTAQEVVPQPESQPQTPEEDPRAEKYDRADGLLMAGDFLGAAEAFEELGDYGDSAERAKFARYTYALCLVESGDREGALEQFEMLGDYQDSAERAGELRRQDLLSQMGYIGDPSRCSMTADQAAAFADKLRAVNRSAVMAAIFDGGGGVPILWIAYADEADAGHGSVARILSGSFDDRLYSCRGGMIEECPWITALLRAGTNGTVVQINKRETDLKFYRLNDGRIEKEPFAYGNWDHSGDATFNGTYIGRGADASLWSFFYAADAEAEILLESVSGESDYLQLVGSWISGDEMVRLLENYAS